MGSTNIAMLLSLALPSPKPLSSKENGDAAVLALALHCLFIRDGFTVEDENDSPARRHSSYGPPVNWQSLPDQWFFTYTKAGRANRFTLHCSLQAATKRMFVQATEEGHPENVQVLGLQVTNYVPDPARLKSTDWTGVLTNEAQLQAYFSQYISVPLLGASEDAPMSPGGAGPSPRLNGTANGRAATAFASHLPALPGKVSSKEVVVYVGLGAVLVGTLLWLHRRRGHA